MDSDAKTLAESPGASAGAVQVTGRVPGPVRFSLAELKAMECEEFEDLFLVCGTGEPRAVIPNCRGVLLEKVIQRSNVDKGEHNDTKRMFISVTAGDGYTVVFSWQEIFNTEIGGGVALLVEKNGQPLDADADRIDLVSSQDYYAGSRYVRDVRTISVILHSCGAS